MIPSNKDRVAERNTQESSRQINTITIAQARVVLSDANLLPRVEAEITKGDARVKIAWEYSTELRRDSTILKALAAKLKLSDEEVDALFKQASEVRF